MVGESGIHRTHEEPIAALADPTTSAAALATSRSWRNDAILTDQRNLERYPVCSRLDLRTNHTFSRDKFLVTRFVEVLNLLNRKNYRPSASWVNENLIVRGGWKEQTLPPLPSAGVLIEF